MPHDWIKYFVTVFLAAGSSYLAIRDNLTSLNADMVLTKQRVDRLENNVYK